MVIARHTAASIPTRKNPKNVVFAAGTGAYTEVAIGNGGTTGAAVASGKVGAVLYDTIPAGAKIGDLVRVFFKGL